MIIWLKNQQKMKVNLFRVILIAIGFLTSSYSYGQYIIIPEGDTLMIVSENGTITDIGGNYMGKFGSDGTIINGQNLLIGKIDINNGKIYDVTFEETATFINNQLIDWDGTLLAIVSNQAVYNNENILFGSFLSLEPLRAIFLLMYYY